MVWGVNDYPSDPERGVLLVKKSLDEFRASFHVGLLNSIIEDMDEEDRANLVYAILNSNQRAIDSFRDQFNKITEKAYNELNPDDDRWMYKEE